MTADVVVVGSLNADLIVRVPRRPGAGETVLGNTLDLLPGGKGANQAVAAARSGATVAMVGAVGDDPYAQTATGLLRATGVDLSAVSRLAGSTGVAVVEVEAGGENAIIVIPGANSAVRSGFVKEHAQLIGQASVVLLEGEIPVDGIETAIALARGRVVLNLAPVKPLAPALIRRSDPLVVNEHEANLVLALLRSEPVRESEAGDFESLASALVDEGVESVIVTLGSYGSVVATSTAVTRVPAAKVKDVIDTTGAGDAYVGALAAGLARGEDLLDAARMASRVAGFAVTRVGAQPSYPAAGDALPALQQ